MNKKNKDRVSAAAMGMIAMLAMGEAHNTPVEKKVKKKKYELTEEQKEAMKNMDYKEKKKFLRGLE